jgi:DNA helicase HerA-like ATPase
VIVNLAKGKIGEDASALLGSLLITSLQIAAIGRANVQESERAPYFLYVDEAHSFATASFASILSEGRKYGLAFGGLATQFLEQLDEPTLASILGNVGTYVAFQMGQRDAEILADQLGDDVTSRDLMTLPKYHAYARLLIDGHPSRPFSLTTQPPRRPPGRLQHATRLRRTSRHRYARPAAAVRQTVARAMALV